METVSQTLGASGDTVAIMAVRQFPPEGDGEEDNIECDDKALAAIRPHPPKLSFNTSVRRQFRYGMWFALVSVFGLLLDLLSPRLLVVEEGGVVVVVVVVVGGL